MKSQDEYERTEFEKLKKLKEEPNQLRMKLRL
jgi:hypothetical protein